MTARWASAFHHVAADALQVQVRWGRGAGGRFTEGLPEQARQIVDRVDNGAEFGD